MKRLCAAVGCLLFCAGLSIGQKATAEPDYYPLGYSLDTWTGQVSAVDNTLRTLTLSPVTGDKGKPFLASIPNSPYEWANDARNFRVVDFPFNKEEKVQVFRFVAQSGLYFVPLDRRSEGTPMQRRPNPPDTNVIDDFSQFMGRIVTVYYTTRERTLNGRKEEYNDVWRIRVYPKKK